MGRDSLDLVKVQDAERRLRDNVIKRLRDADDEEVRRGLEDEFRDITYQLMVAGGVDFESTPEVHPSEVGQCQLRVAFALRGAPRRAPPQKDPKMQLTFAIGTAIHRILQQKYGLLGRDVSFVPEVGIDSSTSLEAERYCIIGHCDGIFEVLRKKPPLRMGLEIKSMAGSRFSALTTPSDGYKTQATVYMACLGLTHMMFVFVNKNSSLIQPILYDFEPDRWEKIKEVLESIMLKVMTGGSVPKHPDHMVCRNMCNYYWLCKPGA